MLSITSLLSLMLRRGESCIQRRMSSTENDLTVKSIIRTIIPDLSPSLHKGQCGRIGVVGGCKEYTGAPYFGGISALKVGADLSHIFCAVSAAPVIKSYSPELIVHPVLDSPDVTAQMDQWLPRMHALVIGPGLGRDPSLLNNVRHIIQQAKTLDLPIVIDADGTFLLSQDPTLIQGYSKAILTPNVVEFSRLYEAVMEKKPTEAQVRDSVSELSSALGNVTILRKGPEDIITDGKDMLVCSTEGNKRRCGGQGDLLAGSMGVFTFWAHETADRTKWPYSRTLVAAYAACMLTRECGRRAFNKHGRSTMTTDMIDEIHDSFDTIFTKL